MKLTGLQKYELREKLFEASQVITKDQYGEAVFHLTLEQAISAFEALEDEEFTPAKVTPPKVVHSEAQTGQAPEPLKVTHCDSCGEPELPDAVHAPWCSR